MDKIKRNMKCPKCKNNMSKLDQYCPGCGHYVGRGQRSSNEMRALITKIKNYVPEIGDQNTAEWYLTFMQGTIAALTWATGELNKDALELALTRIKGNEKK